ncbi:MAG: protein SCO1/2 [Flavobacteriales bacterium]|jgi:protein SCO1/2
MNLIVKLFLIPVLFISCSSNSTEEIPYYFTSDFMPHFASEEALKFTHKILQFELLNQDSNLITNTTIQNKLHVANFIFTTCGSICPIMVDHMKLINDEFPADSAIAFLSYSVTPWIDTPSKLKTYKEYKRIRNPNWHFLTGSKSEIYNLARQGYFAEEDLGFTKDSSDFLHTEYFILVDENQYIRGIYNGTLKTDINQLIKDIRVLKLGATALTSF